LPAKPDGFRRAVLQESPAAGFSLRSSSRLGVDPRRLSIRFRFFPWRVRFLFLIVAVCLAGEPIC